ncbi:MAG: NAD(P)/FAD-dependent oxidoreductase, partial [Chloroflexi bacterium]|nr:NAD(P)/FAD-dependent oxidoreductase [Chloroflexota bacterium]
DRAAFPRDKPCGDGLDHRALTALSNLGLLDRVEKLGYPLEEVRFFAPNGKAMTGRPPESSRPANGFGLIVPRLELDSALRDYALSLGAGELAGCAVAGVVTGGSETEVKARRGGAEISLRAGVVVGADGANSAVARSLGLFPQGRALTSVGMRAYFESVPDLGRRYEVHYFDRDLMPAYGWIFPLSDSVANVGVGVYASDLKRLTADRKANLPAIFQRFVASPRLRGARLISSPAGSLLRHGAGTYPPSQGHVLLVGDAAGLINPLTGEGVSYALRSGQIAAEAILDGLSKSGGSDTLGLDYQSRLQARFGKELAQARRLQGLLRWPWLIDRLASKGSADRVLADNFCGLLGGLVKPSGGLWLDLLRRLML